LTAIFFSAARASSGSSAATIATASPANRTTSMASTGWSWTSRPKVFFPGTSAWVNTALTPGASSAADVSIDTIRAEGCGLRSVAPHSIPSR
jgi:hypothetical protein